jgi:hypothetical protein
MVCDVSIESQLTAFGLPREVAAQAARSAKQQDYHCSGLWEGEPLHGVVVCKSTKEAAGTRCSISGVLQWG